MSLSPLPGTLSGNHKLAGLDHLRALAITLVYLFHCRLFPHPAWVDSVCKFGWTGVDLFFVLSGYLISSQLFQQIAGENRVVLSDFYIKRFFRIIPAYLTIVTLYFSIPAFREWEALPPLWKFLTFTQNFGLDQRTGRTFSHAWSLCIEEQFYLLLPLILALLVYFKALRTGVVLLAGLFIAGFAIRIYSWNVFIAPYIDTDSFGVTWYKYMYYPTYNRLDGLLTGISIAALFQYKPQVKERVAAYGNVLILLGLLILTAAYIVCLDEHTFIASVFGFPLVALGYGALVVGSVSPSCFLYKFKSKLTTHIATLSFAVYLSHKAMIHLGQELFAGMGIEKDSNIMLLLCAVVSVAGALVLNKIIEQPFLKLRHKILKPRS